VYLEAGGFDTALPVGFNDLDLCLRLIQRGYRIVWTPYAELLHLESASRGNSESRVRHDRAEWRIFTQRWGSRADDDPFFNPNLELTPDDKHIALAFPPRWRRPWERSP
jgi:GT2 family glycosyltransferase